MTTMELYQLRSFVMVANEGHLTRAAKRLFISQPAVSAHIKSLEEELGIILFTRTSQGMQLTEKGQILKNQAETSLHAVNELFQQAKLLQDDVTGIVKIGLNTDPDFLRINEFFSVMTEKYPKLAFHLLQVSSWDVSDELRNGNLDASYLYGKEYASDIGVIPLHTYDLLVVGPVHWKERIEQGGWKEISEFPWVWPFPRCPFCQILEEAFSQRNLQPRKAVVADQEPAFKMLATSGVGLTLMIAPEALAAEEKGQLIIWKKHKFQIDLSFAYLRKRLQEPVLQAILNGLFIVWDLRNHELNYT